jgi:hypothetical protein
MRELNAASIVINLGSLNILNHAYYQQIRRGNKSTTHIWNLTDTFEHSTVLCNTAVLITTLLIGLSQLPRD